MTNPETLKTLINLAEQQHDKASKVFAQAASAHRHAQERLELIENYRGEYEDKMRSHTYQGIDGTRVSNYARFIQQLSDAITQQLLEVKHCEQQLEHTRRLFLDAQRKLKSLQILLQRNQQQQALLEARQSQKMIDEFAARARSFNRGFI